MWARWWSSPGVTPHGSMLYKAYGSAYCTRPASPAWSCAACSCEFEVGATSKGPRRCLDSFSWDSREAATISIIEKRETFWETHMHRYIHILYVSAVISLYVSLICTILPTAFFVASKGIGRVVSIMSRPGRYK